MSITVGKTSLGQAITNPEYNFSEINQGSESRELTFHTLLFFGVPQVHGLEYHLYSNDAGLGLFQQLIASTCLLKKQSWKAASSTFIPRSHLNTTLRLASRS